MKSLICIFCFFSMTFLSAQSPEADVKQAVVDFFEAFHAQDSTGMAHVVSENVVLQTIGTNKKGEKILRQENFNDLIQGITSIPDSVHFEEKLLDYSIQIDGAMANAWTPYEFWYNKKFSHCGVNSFQLFKQNDKWKIIYLIDTRRKEGCEGQPD